MLKPVLFFIIFCLRLYKAYKACESLSIAAIQHIIQKNMGTVGNNFYPTRRRAGFIYFERYQVLKEPTDLVITSAITRKTYSAQVVAVRSDLNFEAS